MDIHRTLDHPNIVKVYDVIELPRENFTCIVMEYLPGQDLLEYIHSRPEVGLNCMKETAHIMRQLTSALQYLHEKGIAVSSIPPPHSFFIRKMLTSTSAP